MWKAEDKLRGSVLSFHWWDPGIEFTPSAAESNSTPHYLDALSSLSLPPSFFKKKKYFSSVLFKGNDLFLHIPHNFPGSRFISESLDSQEVLGVWLRQTRCKEVIGGMDPG